MSDTNEVEVKNAGFVLMANAGREEHYYRADGEWTANINQASIRLTPGDFGDLAMIKFKSNMRTVSLVQVELRVIDTYNVAKYEEARLEEIKKSALEKIENILTEEEIEALGLKAA